jgi:hypothetical protein
VTASEFESALRTIGWSHRHVALLLGCHVDIPIRWGKGIVEVPASIGRWLAGLERVHRRSKAPEDWRLRAKNGTRTPMVDVSWGR